jgi:hypothetical protein
MKKQSLKLTKKFLCIYLTLLLLLSFSLIIVDSAKADIEIRDEISTTLKDPTTYDGNDVYDSNEFVNRKDDGIKIVEPGDEELDGIEMNIQYDETKTITPEGYGTIDMDDDNKIVTPPGTGSLNFDEDTKTATQPGTDVGPGDLALDEDSKLLTPSNNGENTLVIDEDAKTMTPPGKDAGPGDLTLDKDTKLLTPPNNEETTLGEKEGIKTTTPPDEDRNIG